MSDIKKPRPKIGAFHSDRWGFTGRITNRVDAVQAVKMSGLPIFLIGVGNVMSSLLGGLVILPQLKTISSESLSLLTLLSFGILMIICGLLLRKGRIWLAPIGIIYLAFALFGIAAYFTVFRENLAFFVFIFTELLLVYLSINGLRGWWWLRQNKSAT